MFGYTQQQDTGLLLPSYELEDTHPINDQCNFLSVFDSIRPRNLAKLDGLAVPGSSGTMRAGIGGIGYGLSVNSTSQIQIHADTNTLLNNQNTNVTFVIIREKLDSLARSSVLFGYDNGAGNRILVHGPWSDGTMYFDYGNVTTGRLSVSGQTWSPRLDHMIFIAGSSKGREIWRNGAKIGGNTGITAPFTGWNQGFFVGSGASGILSDYENIYFFGIFLREWTDAECWQWFDDPYQLLRRDPIAFNFPVSTGVVTTSASGNICLKSNSNIAKESDSNASNGIFVKQSASFSKTSDSSISSEIFVEQSTSFSKIAAGSILSSIEARAAVSSTQLAPNIIFTSSASKLSGKTSEQSLKISLSGVQGYSNVKLSNSALKISTGALNGRLFIDGVNSTVQIAPGIVPTSSIGSIKTNGSISGAKISVSGSTVNTKLYSFNVPQKSSISSSVSEFGVKSAVQSLQIGPQTILTAVQTKLNGKIFSSASKISSHTLSTRLKISSAINLPVLDLNSLSEYTVKYALRDDTIQYLQRSDHIYYENNT